MRQTLDQERAKAAWAKTLEFEGKDFFKNYCSLCAGASATILTNGLGPTLAFYMAKGQEGSGNQEKREYISLVNTIAKWVLNNDTATSSTLMQKITQCNADQYRQLTQETLAYLQWLKRFSEAKKPS